MASNSMWQPTATISSLQERAKILKIIRDFFANRDVLEVDTPLLCRFGVTDPHMNAIQVLLNANEKYYLQTSPEYAMKRLLAAGSGAIYQITKAFRGGDVGNLHNPEFTMLEWYRPEFDHYQLMQEVDKLLQLVLHTKPARSVTYRKLFQQYLSLDPYIVTVADLKEVARVNNFNSSQTFVQEATVDDWLQLLFSYYIAPKLIGDVPWMVYNYPPSQAALATLKQQSGVTVAERFEVYVKGLELANGYHELTDPEQQLLRSQQDQKIRKQLNKPSMEVDDRLIAALEVGLSPCAGVAVGVDRLIMLAVGVANIQEVIAFPVDRA